MKDENSFSKVGKIEQEIEGESEIKKCQHYGVRATTLTTTSVYSVDTIIVTGVLYLKANDVN